MLSSKVEFEFTYIWDGHRISSLTEKQMAKMLPGLIDQVAAVSVSEDDILRSFHLLKKEVIARVRSSG